MCIDSSRRRQLEIMATGLPVYCTSVAHLTDSVPGVEDNFWDRVHVNYFNIIGTPSTQHTKNATISVCRLTLKKTKRARYVILEVKSNATRAEIPAFFTCLGGLAFAAQGLAPEACWCKLSPPPESVNSAEILIAPCQISLNDWSKQSRIPGYETTVARGQTN